MLRVAFIVNVLADDAVSETVAPVLQVTSPVEVALEEAEARSITSRVVSSFCRVVAEMLELVAVANQMPVVPKNEPVVSVEPLTTVKVSA